MSVETGERLAAYLAGELGADETAALEAELARDPALRTRLEAIRATDEALAGLPPVEAPEGFAERLRAAVQAELDQQLGDGAGGDQLAARRARRTQRGTTGTRSWWPQIAVAAAVLAIAGIGLATLGGGAGDDAPTMASGEAATESADTMITMGTPAAGPTVVALGRSFDAESLRELADDPHFDEVVGQGLAGGDAAAAAGAFDAELQGQTAAGDAGSDGDDSGGAGGGMDAAEAPMADAAPEEESARSSVEDDFGLRTIGDVSPEDLEAVRTCLDDLVAEAPTPVIPVYVELVSYEGQDAIVYGLVGNDPAQDTYSRVELWVVGRGDCMVLHYAQVDR